MLPDTLSFGFNKIPSGMDPQASATWRQQFFRIGHSGAAGHVLANTLDSLALALEMGVDMVEFDVRPCRDALILLHDNDLSAISAQYRGKVASECTLAELKTLSLRDGQRIPTFAEALNLLRGRAAFNVDLKAVGYEQQVIEVLQAHHALGDALISSLFPESLVAVRQASAHVKTGLSYPRDRGNASTRKSLKPLVDSVVMSMRYTLPYRIVQMLRRAHANAVMLNHRVVSRRVVEVVQRYEGRVFVWTVDDAPLLQTVHRLRVDGIASNYPELFKILEGG